MDLPGAPTAPAVDVLHLGRTEYLPVLLLQRSLQERRAADSVSDTLLLTEHDPVLTLGRAHPEPDLRVPLSTIERAGLQVVPTERGGDITFHGPGQLVAYAILDLRRLGFGAVDHVRNLEETAIRALAGLGVAGERRVGARGVWVGGRKIASVGVNIRRWVSMHGIALNVDVDTDWFDLINPCGLDGVVMTSVSNELGRSVPVSSIVPPFLAAFAGVYGVALTEPSPGARVLPG